jgi:pyruvate ferredoxin oxidoreductase beta subunit/2-oxoisovalerate ferredoxin oxidoreductase beta subunit
VGVRTSTTPFGKAHRKKDIMGIMAAHRVPYCASLSVAHRDDFIRKMRIARDTEGFRFLLILSPCPTGWKSEPSESVEIIDYAVRSGLFPVYEVFDGSRYRVNFRPDGTSVEEYTQRQRRYRSESVDLEGIRADIEARWRLLDAMERAFPASERDPA